MSKMRTTIQDSDVSDTPSNRNSLMNINKYFKNKDSLLFENIEKSINTFENKASLFWKNKKEKNFQNEDSSFWKILKNLQNRNSKFRKNKKIFKTNTLHFEKLLKIFKTKTLHFENFLKIFKTQT